MDEWRPCVGVCVAPLALSALACFVDPRGLPGPRPVGFRCRVEIDEERFFLVAGNEDGLKSSTVFLSRLGGGVASELRRWDVIAIVVVAVVDVAVVVEGIVLVAVGASGVHAGPRAVARCLRTVLRRALWRSGEESFVLSMVVDQWL